MEGTRRQEICSSLAEGGLWETAASFEIPDTTKRTMQSVLDSFCRCLGTPVHRDVDAEDDVLEKHIDTSAGSPDARSRRMNRLELQDKQWDALFDDHHGMRNSGGRSGYRSGGRGSMGNGSSAERGRSGSGGRSGSNSSAGGSPMCPTTALEQAQAVAKAKLAANPSRHKTHKRKRSLKSRDDIFRQRKTFDNTSEGPGCAGTRNGNSTISRFANHPAVVNALCFATPINEDFDNHGDNHSLTSDTNTLNTCEDTINSMFYLETTQLANIVEKRPPMPLFDQFQVKDNSISKIIATDSHSSLKMLYHPMMSMTQTPVLSSAVNTMNHQHQHHQNNRRNGGQVPMTVSSSDEEIPPTVATSSGSDSSGRRYS